jgi:hypothetical protein
MLPVVRVVARPVLQEPAAEKKVPGVFDMMRAIARGADFRQSVRSE